MLPDTIIAAKRREYASCWPAWWRLLDPLGGPTMARYYDDPGCVFAMGGMQPSARKTYPRPGRSAVAHNEITDYAGNPMRFPRVAGAVVQPGFKKVGSDGGSGYGVSIARPRLSGACRGTLGSSQDRARHRRLPEIARNCFELPEIGDAARTESPRV